MCYFLVDNLGFLKADIKLNSQLSGEQKNKHGPFTGRQELTNACETNKHPSVKYSVEFRLLLNYWIQLEEADRTGFRGWVLRPRVLTVWENAIANLLYMSILLYNTDTKGRDSTQLF